MAGNEYLQISARFLKGYLGEEELKPYWEKASKAQKTLHEKTGAGSEFLGWLDLPLNSSKEEISAIKTVAQKWQKHDYLVVVGIGGSYLGAKAALEVLKENFPSHSSNKFPHIIFAGHHLDAQYHQELLEFLKDKDFCVNVISKSGTTTEPAVAFRLLLQLLEKKYGRAAISERVVATTDAKKGALKKLASEYGFTTFVINDDVGGRFSVLSPVGLLPIAAAGFDIDALLTGAEEMCRHLKTETNPQKNTACAYAVYRNALYQKGKTNEVMVNYHPQWHYFIEWWKQLFGESEGKQNKGIFPVGVDFTSDLHSLGQYLQEGQRNLFEIVLNVKKARKSLAIPELAGDPDGLNFLKGQDLHTINQKALLATQLAHFEGGVPIIELNLAEMSARSLGGLFYFFEYACAISAYMLEVNPFDQPGVEAYKVNMFALLGKPGFEKQKTEVENKLKGI